MKVIISALLCLGLFSTAFAQNAETNSSAKQQIEKITTLSAELNQLKNDLKTAQAEKKADVIKLGVSAATALALAVPSYFVVQRSDISKLGFGLVGAAASAVVVSYAGFNGVMLFVKSNQIDNLVKAIDQKTTDLEKAKAALEASAD